MAGVSENNAVTEEVLRMAIRQISLEMGSVVKRISGSPIITEADDFAAMIYSPVGELLDAAYGAFYTGAGGRCISNLMKHFKDAPLQEGDLILANDPFISGAIHANDMQVVAPIFVDGALIAYAYMHAHVMDVGGIVPGGWAVGAKDYFAESFRLPFVKYMEAGRVNQTVRDIVANNTRLPALVLNDIHGMAVATRGGAEQLTRLARRYGVDAFLTLTKAMLDRSEAAAVKRIRALKDGEYEVTDWIEHNGQRNDLYGVRGRLNIADGTLCFTFTGDAQTDGFINGTPSTLIGSIMACISGMLFWDVPMNEGIFRVIPIRAVPRTVVCSQPPAPVSSNHLEAGFKIQTIASQMLRAAMANASDPELQHRAHANFAASVTMATFSGVDPRNGYVVFADMSGMGSGAGGTPGFDGMDVSCTQAATVIRMGDIETMEEAFPILYLWRGLRTDSGGPGKYRGGVGLDAAWICHGADELLGTINSASGHLPAPGARGGYPGASTLCETIDGVQVADRWFGKDRLPGNRDLSAGWRLPTKISNLALRADQVWRMRMPGGGGWGDPIERDPQAVARDVEIGAVSLEQAASAYGVVLSGDGVDGQATKRLRTEIRAERLSARTLVNEPLDRRMADIVEPCAHCDTPIDLADLRDSSRRASPLAERLELMKIDIDPRDGLLLHEVSCPQCSAMLEVTHDAALAVPKLPGEVPALV